MKSLMLKAAMIGVLFGLAAPMVAQASTTTTTLQKACAHLTIAGCSGGDQGLDTKGANGTTYLQDLVDTFLYIAGAVAVIFIIIGGIRYITSTGDAARVKAAKDTVLYAIIGLIVAILAVPISGYVIAKVSG